MTNTPRGRAAAPRRGRAAVRAPFRAPERPWCALRFWWAVLRQTLGDRQLGALVDARLAGIPVHGTGLEHLPATGSVVLACNHYRGGSTHDVLAAVLAAARSARPALADDLVVVVGQRRASRRPAWPLRPLVAAVRAVHGAAMRRWDRHLLRVPWQNATASTTALRAWRQTAATRPLLVFPEGRLSVDLEPVRPGAGAWLARGSAPVVPVGVWWDGDAWRVRIGPPIAWSARDDLRDAQLQLSLAAVLPPALTQRWAPALAAWRAHRAAAVRAA